MWHLPVALAEIEIHALPAAVGAAIFLSWQLLARASALRSSNGWTPQKPEDRDKDTGKARCFQREAGGQRRRREEPLLELAPEPGGTRRTPAAVLWHTVVLASILAVFASFLHGWGCTPGPPGFQRVPMQAVGRTEVHPDRAWGDDPGERNGTGLQAEGRDTLRSLPDVANASLELAAVGQVCSSTDCQELLGPAEAALTNDSAGDEAVLTNDSQRDESTPFNIKLHRQAYDAGGSDYVRSAYYGTLKVGTPAVEMTVVFDTGSGHLILPSVYCHSETCKVHRRYRRSASSTGRDINARGRTVGQGVPREAITVSFGTGEVTGVMIEDIICFGQPANISASLDLPRGEFGPGCVNFRFLAATSLSEDPFASFNFDGVLGLGLLGLSEGPEFNFMETFARSLEPLGGRASKTFGVFLASTASEESEISLGGWAEEHLAEDVSWNRVHDPELGHWILPVRRIRIDNLALDFCDDGTCLAAVDTGTSLLSVPTAIFRDVYNMLLHPAPPSGSCKGFGPMIHIELEHATVSLGPREYSEIKKKRSPSIHKPGFHDGNCTQCGPATRGDLACQPMLMTMDLPEPLGPKLFILGEPVLRRYYTIYDAQKMRIGIGRAKHRFPLSRDDLLTVAPELRGRTGAAAAKTSRAGRQSRPTMFEVFRWRKATESRLAL